LANIEKLYKISRRASIKNKLKLKISVKKLIFNILCGEKIKEIIGNVTARINLSLDYLLQ